MTLASLALGSSQARPAAPVLGAALLLRAEFPHLPRAYFRQPRFGSLGKDLADAMAAVT